MASIAVDFDQWRESLVRRLPAGLVDVLSGGSRKQLLKQVKLALLVFDDQVLNLATGQLVYLGKSAADSTIELARACGEVAGGPQQDVPVLLLLPPREFVATTVSMPGLNREALTSALTLQASTLLPSHGGKLVPVVNPLGREGVHAETALWISEERLDHLYQTFQKMGLLLTAVLPRCLALADTAGDLDLLEKDADSVLRVQLQNGSINRWLRISRKDLEQEIFRKQWDQAQGPRSERMLEISTSNATEKYRELAREWEPGKDYCIFPRGALNAARRMQKGRRVVLLAGLVVVVALIGALPFIAQSVQMRILGSSLESQRELSSNARQDRAAVQEFEQQWGVLSDFPQQDVVAAMYTLQELLSPEQLSSFELNEGVISIEGESDDPQAILQRLEQHPRFTEVAFARATSNSRYYIDLRLSTVNFEGYMVRYFPDQ